MVYSRLNLSHVVSMVSRYMHDPVGVIGRQWSELYSTSKIPQMVWCSRRILQVSKSVSDLLIQLRGASTSTDLRRSMYSHCPKYWWVGALFYSLLSLCLLWRPSIWSWQRLWRRQFGFNGCLTIWKLIVDLLRINYDNMSDIYLAKNQSIMQQWNTFPLCTRYSWWEWHRAKEDSHEEESRQYAYQSCSRVKSTHYKKLLHILLVAWVRLSSFEWTMDGLIPQAVGT